MKLIRKFKCGLTGDNCVIVEKNGEEICLLEEEMLTGEKSPVERLGRYNCCFVESIQTSKITKRV